MRRVELASKSIKEYQGLIGQEAVSAIEALAEPLRDARVLHLNATAYGGGVAELLPTLVGLKRGLGIEAEWYALSGNDAFFELTKKLHNGLQGMDIELSPGLRGLYLSALDANREAFKEDWDYVVVHDPQPAGLVGVLDGRRTGRWLWRCHVDTTSPNDRAIDFLAPYMDSFDLAIFTLPEYASPKLSPKRSEFVYPSIDPLSPKNQVLASGLSRQILENRFGIDPDRPLMTQVSRYDPWKDPLGVIDAYRLAKERVSGVQLALVGNLADDDPEGREYHARSVQYAGHDPDIHVLSTLDRLSQDPLTHALEINAFQSGSDVVIQKSTREGFGLVVAEAMWKSTPVVGGNVGGIVHQIDDGENGYLVADAAECAERVVEILRHPVLRRELGERARETVRERFLTPRHLADYLRILRSLDRD
jgi:trehalose synthase